MSLYIEEGRVRRVLLADGWHSVHGESFMLDSYVQHAFKITRSRLTDESWAVYALPDWQEKTVLWHALSEPMRPTWRAAWADVWDWVDWQLKKRSWR